MMTIPQGSHRYVQEMFDILGDEVSQVTSVPEDIQGALRSTFYLQDGRHYLAYQFVFINQFLTPEYLVSIYEHVEEIIRSMEGSPGPLVLMFPAGSRQPLGRILTVNAASLLELVMEIDVEVWFIDYDNSIIESLLIEEFMSETGRDILDNLSSS